MPILLYAAPNAGGFDLGPVTRFNHITLSRRVDDVDVIELWLRAGVGDSTVSGNQSPQEAVVRFPTAILPRPTGGLRLFSGPDATMTVTRRGDDPNILTIRGDGNDTLYGILGYRYG